MGLRFTCTSICAIVVCGPSTPLHRGRRTVRWAWSSATCPYGAALPTRDTHTLRRLSQRDDVARSFRKTSTNNFDVGLDTAEDRSFIADSIRRLKPQHQLCAALCAWMLCQEQDARLCSLGSRTIAIPRCQRHTRDSLRREASHVEHDRAEAAALQKQVRCA
jgi:hypothetical protein